MKPILLQVNYRKNPIGIDEVRRFSWKCEAEEKETGKKQKAYQIFVKNEAGEIVYDSGKVYTDKMHAEYLGRTLHSMEGFSWQVKIWDEKNEATVSETAYFEIGLKEKEDWSAKWITGVGTDQEERLPVDYFQKNFEIKGTIKKARLYASACGVYSCRLNEQRLPGVLAPGTTEYEKRIYYQTYDVTELLKPGENRVQILLGDGWFKGKLGSTNVQCFFGTQTKLIAQIVVTYTNGETEVIGTDQSWDWCNDGPICYTDLKDGEIYDARKTPSFSNKAIESKYESRLLSAILPNIVEKETFKPTLIHTPKGDWVLDFGQNFSGYIKFNIKTTEKNQKIVIQMSEALEHGEFSRKTLLHVLPDIPSINQEIVYISSGGTAEFEPEFFYSGFRYAKVSGVSNINPDDFIGVAIYTDIEYCGSFTCSNEKINQFVKNTIWSQKSNFIDVPTDCPQREKSGWTGDAQVFAKTASYFADTAAFYRKWLKDVRDCQREDGRVENVCPKIRVNDTQRDVLNGSTGWGDAAVIIPYTMWKLYGDVDFITENYELMHGWKEYIKKAASDKSYYHLPEGHPLKTMIEPFLLKESEYSQYIVESGLHWGEWCEPDVENGKELIRPKQEISAAYNHYSMRLLSEMFYAIGKNEEAKECEEFSEGAKCAYNYYFVKDGKIDAPRQAPMVRSLALGLLDKETAIKVASSLNQDVIERKYHVGTGFLSTPFVLSVLVKYGYVDTAYRMLENTEAPGWLAMVEQGATSVWETYKAYDEKGDLIPQSMNHYSPGAVCSFLFEDVCGIHVESENSFVIQPIPGGSLIYAEAIVSSPYGVVKSRWDKVEDGYQYAVEIPANTRACVKLPDGKTKEIESGRFLFTNSL